MDMLNNIGRRISGAAKNITRKSEDMVEITKLNLTISNEEEKINRMLFEMGSELYRSYTNGNAFGDFYEGKCNEVRQLEENLNVLKEKLLLLKGSKTCKNCNSIVNHEVNYCPNCGEKLDKKEE